MKNLVLFMLMALAVSAAAQQNSNDELARRIAIADSLSKQMTPNFGLARMLNRYAHLSDSELEDMSRTNDKKALDACLAVLELDPENLFCLDRVAFIYKRHDREAEAYDIYMKLMDMEDFENSTMDDEFTATERIFHLYLNNHFYDKAYSLLESRYVKIKDPDKRYCSLSSAIFLFDNDEEYEYGLKVTNLMMKYCPEDSALWRTIQKTDRLWHLIAAGHSDEAKQYGQEISEEVALLNENEREKHCDKSVLKYLGYKLEE